MTNQQLDRKLKSKAAQERTLTKEILWDIVEVEKRKLYLSFAYPSLFAYLTESVGYSEGAAQRRIDAARLLAKIPEVSASIEKGSIHLAQVSKMQRICRQIKKQSGHVVEVKLQKSILQKLEHKNSTQTDLILAQELNVKIEAVSKTKIQSDESVRVELTFTKEEMALIETARTILSNKTGGHLKDTIVEMAKVVIKQAAPRKVDSTATVAVKSVTPRLKREILQRDQVCQFTDPITGRKCNSKFYLEVDHIQPRFMNGPNTNKNLRMLCKSHNIFRYMHNM